MLEQQGYTIERGAPYARGASSDARAPRGGAGKSPVKPTIFSAAELRRREFDPIRYVVPGYIAEGCTLLAGRPKLGKSWLVLEAGLAVARGGDCLGGIACEQGDVLYLALEDNARRLQRRMDKVLGAFTEEWPEAFQFATEWPRANEGGIDAIRDWIMAAHPDAELLAHRTALLNAHAEHADARAVNESMKIGTPEYDAEVRVARRLWSLISDTFAMPAPKTMEGLAVIGLALALHTEGAVCGCEPDDEEFVAVSAARAILSVTGTGLPADFMGYGDEPDFRERERIALHGRVGRIADWAWAAA